MHSLVASSTIIERLPDPAMFASASTADEDCLEHFMSGFSQMLAADGLLIASHHGTEPPIILFKHGKARWDAGIARNLVRCAAQALDDPASKPGAISVSKDGLAGTVLTAALLVRDLAITVTTVFHEVRSGRLNGGRERLESLLPFAWPFLRMWSQRKDASHRLFGLEAALHNTYSSTLLLDPAGQLLFANSSAQAFLTANRGLAVNRGRLTASSLTETLRLAAAIEHLCSPGRGDKSTTPVLAIKRRDMRPLLVTLAVSDAHQSENEEPIIVVRLFDPDQDPSDFIEPVCRFYGLSLSESRLTRYIAQGRSLTAAAAEMGIREQTARSYLKQIFLKTETNRQAELAALMLRSAVRLEPRCRIQVF